MLLALCGWLVPSSNVGTVFSVALGSGYDINEKIWTSEENAVQEWACARTEDLNRLVCPCCCGWITKDPCVDYVVAGQCLESVTKQGQRDTWYGTPFNHLICMPIAWMYCMLI